MDNKSWQEEYAEIMKPFYKQRYFYITCAMVLVAIFFIFVGVQLLPLTDNTVTIKISREICESVGESLEYYEQQDEIESAMYDKDGNLLLVISKSEHKKILESMEEKVCTELKAMIGAGSPMFIEDIQWDDNFDTVTVYVDRATYKGYYDFTPFHVAISVNAFKMWLPENNTFDVVMCYQDNNELISRHTYPAEYDIDDYSKSESNVSEELSVSESESSSSEESSLSFTIEEFAVLLQTGMNQIEGTSATVTVSGNTVNIQQAYDSLDASAALIKKNPDTYRAAWELMVSAAFSDSIYESMVTLAERVGLSNITFVHSLVSETNPETVYAIYVNGEEVYNFLP